MIAKAKKQVEGTLIVSKNTLDRLIYAEAIIVSKTSAAVSKYLILSVNIYYQT